MYCKLMKSASCALQGSYGTSGLFGRLYKVSKILQRMCMVGLCDEVPIYVSVSLLLSESKSELESDSELDPSLMSTRGTSGMLDSGAQASHAP
jgi:hypothetical protein